MDIDDCLVLNDEDDEKTWAEEIEEYEKMETQQQPQQAQPPPPSRKFHIKNNSIEGVLSEPVKNFANVVIFDAQFNTVQHMLQPREICVKNMSDGVYFHTGVKPTCNFNDLSNYDKNQNTLLYGYHGIYWGPNIYFNELKLQSCNNLLRMLLKDKKVIVRGKQKLDYLVKILNVPMSNIIHYIIPLQRIHYKTQCTYHRVASNTCAFQNCNIIYKQIYDVLKINKK